MKREKLIQDRHGRVLHFTQERTDGFVYFKLMFHKACAAYANCHIGVDVLMIADLFVEDRCIVPQPSFFMRLLGHKTLAVNFRNQGIGSQLLITMITYAKSKGLKRIEGRMAGTDLNPNPKLPQWYQKRGFKVEESLVYMDLAQSAEDHARYMPKA